MGCKSEEDSYPPIHYGYNLAFVDENGNDLIEGMQTGLGRNGKPALREKDYSYKLVEPDSKDDFTGPDCIYVESRDGLLLWQSLMHYGMDINMTRRLKY